MSKNTVVSLSPNGFPWRALLIGIVILGAVMIGGVALFPAAKLGGIFIVAALLGLAGFAGSLG